MLKSQAIFQAGLNRWLAAMLQFLQQANHTLSGGASRRLQNPMLKGAFAPVEVSL